VIAGARRPEQLADNLAATQVELSDDEMQSLDEVSRLPANYPGWLFERQGESSALRVEPRAQPAQRLQRLLQFCLG
jgi:hypothetical protein